MAKREKTRKQIVGTFVKNKNFGFVIPDNKELKTDIFIKKSNFKKAKNNQKVIIEITKPEMKNKKPEGKIVEIVKVVERAAGAELDSFDFLEVHIVNLLLPGGDAGEADTIQGVF